jgi:hypothetical protein
MKQLLRALAITLLLAVCGGLVGCATLGPYPDYVVYDEYGRVVGVIPAPPSPVLVPVPYPYYYPYGGYPHHHHHHYR